MEGGGGTNRVTFSLSLMDPFPRIDIFVRVSSCSLFNEFPRGPRSLPTKLNCNRQRVRVLINRNLCIWLRFLMLQYLFVCVFQMVSAWKHGSLYHHFIYIVSQCNKDAPQFILTDLSINSEPICGKGFSRVKDILMQKYIILNVCIPLHLNEYIYLFPYFLYQPSQFS